MRSSLPHFSQHPNNLNALSGLRRGLLGFYRGDVFCDRVFTGEIRLFGDFGDCRGHGDPATSMGLQTG